MNVCSPHGLGQADIRRNTGVATQDMKHLQHNEKFIHQVCIKTTGECGIFQIYR